ncbi:MAG TPA: hypothetical protein VJW93_04820 [Candidatus Acidoferrales bacterium]|nr:hypothetical protein [Candidatus Acidoferrales bacterium]
MRRMGVLLAAAVLLVSVAVSIQAQDQAGAPSNGPSGTIPPGTRFLVGLDEVISTKEVKAGTHFKVHTLEPMSAPDGATLPPGTEIRGHVDKVEQAHQTGRARIWLTFDDVRTSNKWQPLVAFVSDVPGVHSVHVVFEREGAIEARTSKAQDQAEAAAAGAFVGAAPGVVAHNGKDAAIGAAAGAVTAFMLSSGLGQELTLEKNTKLELSLDHPLYVGR